MVPRAAVVALLAGSLLATPVLAASGLVSLPKVLAAQIAKAKKGKVAVLLPATLRADAAASKLYGAGA